MGMYDQEQGSGGGGGFGSRLILPFIIAMIGLLMYMSNTQENPVTHQKQHVALSPAQETRLGLESAPQMAREMGGELPASDPRSQTVQAMGRYLVSHTIAHDSPWHFQFHLLADPKTINAFALPGGQIFITLGLYEKLQTEAQLAGVLGHEMGHVIERHTAQQMAKNQLGEAMVAAVGVASYDPHHPNYNGAMIASVVNQVVQLRYSRKDESQADEWGLKLMEQAGFNPYAMIQVMDILKEASKHRGGIEMFQTHPDPDLRIERITAYLKANPPPKDLTDGRSLNQSNQQ